MYARFHAASRLVRALRQQQRDPACLATAWSSPTNGDALHHHMQASLRWLHVSPTLLEGGQSDDDGGGSGPAPPTTEDDSPSSPREQELDKLRSDLEHLVTLGRRRKSPFRVQLPDFVQDADAEQLAKLRKSLAKTEARQRDAQFALLQRDLDLIEAKGMHFHGLEALRADALKTKTTPELVAIRQQLNDDLQTGKLLPRNRPVMEDTTDWVLYQARDSDDEGKDADGEEGDDQDTSSSSDQEKIDARSLAMLSDVDLLRRPYYDVRDSSKSISVDEFRKWMDESRKSALEGARLVKTTIKEDGTEEQEDLGPATDRDMEVYNNPGYQDMDDKLLRKREYDLALKDSHPFGGSLLPRSRHEMLMRHPIDNVGLGPDIVKYLLRREVVVHLTHELDEKGESDLADLITEELKDRDFEIIGRLMMQERAAEGALLMETLMAGQGLPDGLESISRALSYDEDKEVMLARRRAARLEAESSTKVIEQEVDKYHRAIGTGRRKSSVAVVSVWPGSGNIVINNRPLGEFFSSTTRRDEVLQPLLATDTLFDVDVRVRVRGGGVMGQAQAIRHGLAVALQKYDPDYRAVLRYYDLVTRDSREVERKKPGRAKARKAFQWVKR